ncbi:hypothetical protein DPMN_112333 [Dreissena polymorpha]|uniref:Uncharacterized protein n=1 Tax=Dreissena polymorpha TaxID=45954 RepID=A0A9D4KGV5_DREPO|nr:hypothetical protein DPMN_112333 [Dreissena polymorpha]
MKPGRCRSPAGVLCRHSPLSASGVTVYRGSAGTLPALTGAQPGHYRRQPVLYQGFTGIKRSQSGLTGTLPGF